MNDSLPAIRALAHDQLSLRARLGYFSLLLVAAAMSVVIVALWLTEPALPARTQVAFGAMAGIGAAWVGFATWVLRARRPLYARDRVIAGRLAVAFTAVFTAGALSGVLLGGGSAALAACLSGLLMLCAAIAALRAARRRVKALAARLRELEQLMR